MSAESDLKAWAVKFLKTIPNSKFIPYCPYPYGEPGSLDKVGCINGQMWWIEFKAPGKKLTVLQARRIMEWESAGAKTLVIDNKEKLKEALCQMK